MHSFKQESLDAAVKYLSAHNSTFIDREDYIRQSLLEAISQLDTEKCLSAATMGFVVSLRNEEDSDGSYPDIRIMIDLDVLNARNFTKMEAPPYMEYSPP